MYYGEEIGMRTTEPARKEDVRDPIGITGWPKEKGRDGERTPMQWTSAAPNAGFTVPTATPWLPVPSNARTINVETESADPNSLLNFYKGLLRLRHPETALMFGGYETLTPDDPSVFSFERKVPPGGQGRNIIVALNMSDKPHTVKFDGVGAKGGVVLQSSFTAPGSKVDLGSVELPPFGATVIEVE